mmetsp:Transcript_27033/g.74351  ORF Transcript_27033/g.74351 Transcript_27033/m.74351 type:complete len:271 (+) Transcript_27033:428-1240(+)
MRWSLPRPRLAPCSKQLRTANLPGLGSPRPASGRLLIRRDGPLELVPAVCGGPAAPAQDHRKRGRGHRGGRGHGCQGEPRALRAHGPERPLGVREDRGLLLIAVGAHHHAADFEAVLGFRHVLPFVQILAGLLPAAAASALLHLGGFVEWVLLRPVFGALILALGGHALVEVLARVVADAPPLAARDDVVVLALRALARLVRRGAAVGELQAAPLGSEARRVLRVNALRARRLAGREFLVLLEALGARCTAASRLHAILACLRTLCFRQA